MGVQGTRWLMAVVVLGGLVAGCHGGGGKKHSTATPTLTAPPAKTATATIGVPSATRSATPTPTNTSAQSPTPTATGTPDPSCPVGPIDTTVGVICGTTAAVSGTPVHAYLGIPFGESTGGENRWEPPIAKARMTTRFQATQFGDICPQTNDQPQLTQSEDCLSLNVWTPADAQPGDNLPVMVFIYGGAFLDGASAFPLYDAAYLSATQNAVVVTLNYRVGALGFLGGVAGLEGNYGLRDQQLGLQWVQDNVAKFGGNPLQVMLFGESAGGISVGLHLLSIPSSEGYFSGAIMESNPLALPLKSPAQATTFGTCFEMLLGCASDDLECLRGKPVDEILAAQVAPALLIEGVTSGFAGFLVWAPMLDGTLVTQQPLAGAAAGLPKPIVIGTNANEGTVFVYAALAELKQDELSAALYEALLNGLFGSTAAAEILDVYPAVSGDNAPVLSQVATDYMFFCPSRKLAAAGVSQAYAYEFTQVSNFNLWPEIPQCADQVCHSDEVPYVFNTATNIGHSFTPAEQALSVAMSSYWGAFSRPGHDPNNGGATRPTWPEFTGYNYLDLGTPITPVVDPPHNCDLWDDIGYELVNPVRSGAPCMPLPTPTPTP